MKPSGEKIEQIGVATMKPDGTIIIYSGFQEADGRMTDGYSVYKPGDPYYEQMIKRLGGIKPGENKPFFKP